jgi:general secretion pathway protein B
MSLILDALRKSEAERRRGQAPDLFASLPAPSAPSAGGRSRYWAALVLGLLVIGAGFVFWQVRAPEPMVVADAEENAATAATAAADRSEPAQSAAAVAVPSPAPTLAPPVAPAPDQFATRKAPAAPPAATGTPAPAPAAASGAPAVRPPAPVAIAPAPSPVPLPALPATPAPPASVPTPAASPDDSAESLPPIAVLGASERAALPPLKLSMHVWNSEPGKRFAIIDGQRVTEGSSAGASVIEEIRRDGVVLNINGRRVLLPRP